MKNTSFEVEVIFGDVISKDSKSPEQITKLNNFPGENNANINFSIKINSLKPRKDKNKNYELSAPTELSIF